MSAATTTRPRSRRLNSSSTHAPAAERIASSPNRAPTRSENHEATSSRGIWNWLAYTSSPRSYRSFAMAAVSGSRAGLVEGPGGEVDPLRVVPGGPAGAGLFVDGRYHIVGRGAAGPPACGFGADIVEVVADIADQRGVVHLTVAGNDNLGIQREELIEEVDPVAAVDVGVVGGEIRQDRKHPRLEEIASEQDPVIDEYGLI